MITSRTWEYTIVAEFVGPRAIPLYLLRKIFVISFTR